MFSSILNRLTRLKLGPKLMGMGIGSVVITMIVLITIAVWQVRDFNVLANEEIKTMTDTDLDYITEGVYRMVELQDQLVQSKVNYDLEVARYTLNQTGQVSLAEESVTWTAVNQYTKEPAQVDLPKSKRN